MTGVSRITSMAVLGAALLAACGARTGLPFDDGPGPGSTCAGPDIPVEPQVPNLYFILDRSGSMKQQNKWQTVRTVVGNLMTTLGPTARFGAAVFPAPDADTCGVGAEVMPIRRGDTGGAAAAALLAATNMLPKGGTPTAATVTTLTSTLHFLAGQTFAILATDGGPNCDELASCDVEKCTANIDAVDPQCAPHTLPNCCDPAGLGGPAFCLDEAATIDAITKLNGLGIQTFVIGIPGSAPYANMLEEMAKAGGTARATSPGYFRVDSADASALEAALAEIAAKIIATCQLTLDKTPHDPAGIKVTIGGANVPKDPHDGWQIDGTTMKLFGAACDAEVSAGAAKTKVTDGCGTSP